MHAGIEAVSRGAEKAILCDNSKHAIDIIKKNVDKTHTKEKIYIYQSDFKEVLKNKIKEKMDIVFIDPPYESDFAIQAVKLIISNNLIYEDGLIIIETDQEEKIIEQLQDLEVEVIDKRKYGRVHLIFLEQNRKG